MYLSCLVYLHHNIKAYLLPTFCFFYKYCRFHHCNCLKFENDYGELSYEITDAPNYVLV